MGTKGGGGIDVVGVDGGGEWIAESAHVEVVCVIVPVCVVAAVHWEAVDVWVVIVERESGVVLMSVGIDDGDASGDGSCGYSMSSWRGFCSVFELDFKVFGVDIGVLGADLFQGLGFGFVEFLVASVEEVVICRALFGVRGVGCTGVGM